MVIGQPGFKNNYVWRSYLVGRCEKNVKTPFVSWRIRAHFFKTRYERVRGCKNCENVVRILENEKTVKPCSYLGEHMLRFFLLTRYDKHFHILSAAWCALHGVHLLFCWSQWKKCEAVRILEITCSFFFFYIMTNTCEQPPPPPPLLVGRWLGHS